MPATLQLALLIAILLPASKLAASLCTRFGIPAILGELLVGVVAGPGAFDLLHLSLFHGGQATNAFLMMAQVGGLVLMFIAGLETDIERMREASVTAFLVALSGVIWPFFLGAGAAHALGLPWNSALFLGGALTATSVSISARTLMDAGKMSSPEASVILGAAVIDDVMGLFVLAFLAASSTTGTRGSFGLAALTSDWLRLHSDTAAHHSLLVQMSLIAVCVGIFLWPPMVRQSVGLIRSSCNCGGFPPLSPYPAVSWPWFWFMPSQRNGLEALLELPEPTCLDISWQDPNTRPTSSGPSMPLDTAF
jgi:Kef-type K+ transport system membrane component KefB